MKNELPTLKLSLKETGAIAACGASVAVLIMLLSFFLILAQDKMAMAAYTVGVRSRVVMNDRDSEITRNAISLCKSSYASDFVFFGSIYNYTDVRNFNSPDSILVNGSNCQGSAAWYDYAFRSSGITSWFVTEPEHIYVKAALNDSKGMEYVCSFDQGIIECVLR
jgi:hypothetical protein